MSTPDATNPEPLLFDAADIDRVHEASWTLSHLATLASWAGRGITDADREKCTPQNFCALGQALQWMAVQIERQCAVIDEAV